MLKENVNLFSRLLMVADAFIIGSIISVPIIRLKGNSLFYNPLYFYEYVFYLVWGILTWIIILDHFECYRYLRKMSYTNLTWRVFKSVLVATLLFGMAAYLLNSKLLSRQFILFAFSASLLLLLSERGLLLLFLHVIRKKGYNSRRFLVVGSGKRAKQFASLLETHQEWGINLLGFVDEPERVGWEVIHGKRVIGTFNDLEKIISNQVVDEVVFCMPRKWLDKTDKYVAICEDVGTEVLLSLDFFNTIIAKPRVVELDRIPLLSLRSTPSQVWELFVKRTVDIIVSLTLLVILFPVFLMVIMMVKFTSSGPVFFGQERCGLRGRRFTMWKFRTMVQDAEKLKSRLENLNEASGPVFKIKNDPRMTPVGKYLRKYSLDELPQLINVLTSDMSIVGPRPPIPSEVEKYDRWHRRRLSVRPGLTCLWQIQGRNKVSFEDWVKMDLEYIDRWCLSLDIKIILKTIPAIIAGTGV